MIFRQIQEIIVGTKTQTRRIVKTGERFLFDDGDLEHIVIGPNNRLKWQVGRDYVVSPGRGKPGVWCNPISNEWRSPGFADPRLFWQPLRIEITAIRCEPLQSITESDARAEGWPGLFECNEMMIPWYAKLWNSINTRKGTRWDDNPDVWVIEFEVKK